VHIFHLTVKETTEKDGICSDPFPDRREGFFILKCVFDGMSYIKPYKMRMYAVAVGNGIGVIPVNIYFPIYKGINGSFSTALQCKQFIFCITAIGKLKPIIHYEAFFEKLGPNIGQDIH
jgi:hypothetical protein